MAITLTPRLGLTQWGAGSDPPGRTAFNTVFSRIDSAAAVDDGTNGAALPTTGVNGVAAVGDGRYAQTVNGVYRKLYRRAGGAWSQVGGNSWGETQYARADGALPTSDPSLITSHPSLANPTVTESWDGSSIRSGRQAVTDANPALPGAFHAGDASAASMTSRGRFYALTAGTGGRGFAARAGAADAGALFAAFDSSGGEPWSVNAAGQMRSQAATAFGGAGLTAGVPLASTPGASDATAADFTAAGVKPATRWYRTAGDLIGSIAADTIALGKAGWSGGVIGLTAPTINLVGAAAVNGSLAVTGTAAVSGLATLASLLVSGNAQVNGSTTVQGLAASSITASTVTTSGQLRGATVVADGSLTAQGGLVSTATSGSGAELRTRPPTQVSGTSQQSVRAPYICTRSITSGQGMPPAEAYVDVAFVMPEDGWLRVDSTFLVKSDAGASNDIEPAQGFFTLDLRNAGGLIQAGAFDHAVTVINDDTGRQQQGQVEHNWVDVYNSRLTAGSYTLRVRYSRTSVLVPYFMKAKFVFTPVVLHSTS